MLGNISLITGATAGIGKETALGLAQRGSTVVIVGRNREKAERVAEEIRTVTKNRKVYFLIADLSSQKEVRDLARRFREEFGRLDVLVNNAGGVFGERMVSADGIEYTLALNHLAYFLLTNELLDLLKANAPSRIVNLSSQAQMGARIDWNDVQAEKKYISFPQYCNTKLMNLMFTYELDRRLRGTGVTVNAVHPGVVASNFGSTLGVTMRNIYKVIRPFMRSSKKGAETVIYLASSPEGASVSGKYFKDKKELRSLPISYDEQACIKLWEISEQLTSVRK